MMGPWGKKRYYALDLYLKKRYGGKTAKLSIDAGFTCPNRDGSKGFGGCVFCGSDGAGAFTGDCGDSITAQIEKQKLKMIKWKPSAYLAYFQSFSNTYGSLLHLKALYDEALTVPDVVGLAVATRPDLIDEERADLLASYGQRLAWVELGLQSAHPVSMQRLQLRYTKEDVLYAVHLLRERGVDVVIHVIFGLFWERAEEMLETIDFVNALKVQGIKIHMLHVVENTVLARLYKRSPFPLLSREEYITLVVSALSVLDPTIVIHRLTGDGPKESTLAPLWTRDKRAVLGGIDLRMRQQRLFQGSFYE